MRHHAGSATAGAVSRGKSEVELHNGLELILLTSATQATGRARGFAFVEMRNDGDALRAVTERHVSQLDGRRLTVNEARPKPAAAGGGGRSFGEWLTTPQRATLVETFRTSAQARDDIIVASAHPARDTRSQERRRCRLSPAWRHTRPSFSWCLFM